MSQRQRTFPCKSRPCCCRVSSRDLVYRVVLSICCAWLLVLVAPVSSPGLTTSAQKDQTCAGYRSGNMTCTAGEFTVSPVFSAAPGTPPFCVAGNAFSFKVDLGLSGTNTDRYDIGFFVGQQGNDPQATTAGNICSVATFSETPSPWIDADQQTGDSCGDYLGGATSTTTIDEIKVVCQGDSVGALQVPYVLTYWQNTGNVCTGPADVSNGAPSKCNAGTSAVSGTVAVYSGAYVDVTKQTSPDGDSQSFSFTATGPAGSKVIALTGATLTATTATGGTYTPATIAAATNSTTVSLSDGQTARIYINALAANQTLTITEAATTNWESSAAISCAAVTGSPALTTNNGTRTITATLNTANAAAACTVTNTKRSRNTLIKSVGGRLDPADQFTVSAGDGGTLTGTTSATTAGSGTTASTTFYSTPNTPLTLTDAKSSGPTPLANYETRLTCSNAYTGPGATPDASLPNNLSTVYTGITPAPGDDITCTYTNTPKATLTKSFSTGSIGIDQTATLTFTITNPAGAPARTGGITFTDAFPANLVVAGTPNVVNNCGGAPTISAPAGTGTFIVGGTGVNAAAGASTCTISVDVTSSTALSGYVNGAAQITAFSDALLNGVTSQTLNVLAPPTVTKAFGAVNIPVGGSTTLTLTLANPAANVAAITGVQVDDTFPAGLTLWNTTFTFIPAVCGTITKTSGAASAAGDNNLRFLATSIAGGATCQVSVNVTSSTAGSITNTSTSPTTTGPVALTGSTANASLTVYALPLLSILKSADRATANPGEVIVYSVQIANTGTGVGTNVVLTDDLSPYGSFYLGAGAPFSFTDSSPVSGLSLSAAQYSNNNGTTWLYPPVSGGGGAPAGYDGNVTNWRIPMTGTIRAGGSFILNYQVMVK